MTTNTFVTGDAGTVIERTVKDQSGVAVNLTGATVRLRWTQKGVTSTKTMSVYDAVNGIARYTLQTNDLQQGQVEFEIEVTDVLGNVFTAPDLDGPYLVRKQMG